MNTPAQSAESPTARKLVDHFGGIRQTADAFGLHRETVRLWLTRGIPLDRSIEAEQLSKGVVTAEEVLSEAKQAA